MARAGAGPSHAAALIAAVTKPERNPADVLDDAVTAFAAGVGQAGVGGGDDQLLLRVHGRGQGW